MRIEAPASRHPQAQLYRENTLVPDSGVEAAAAALFECAVPLAGLGATTDAPIQFFVELLRKKQSIERIPHEGAIETSVPPSDYELIMWQV